MEIALGSVRSTGPTVIFTRDARIHAALRAAGLHDVMLVENQEESVVGRTLEISISHTSGYQIALSGTQGFPARPFDGARSLAEILNRTHALNHSGDVRPALIQAFEKVFASPKVDSSSPPAVR